MPIAKIPVYHMWLAGKSILAIQEAGLQAGRYKTIQRARVGSGLGTWKARHLGTCSKMKTDH